jgi:serine-type D-Ala-D-Ala carboxypeptidase (penicillin-binding protein 5/6)
MNFVTAAISLFAFLILPVPNLWGAQAAPPGKTGTVQQVPIPDPPSLDVKADLLMDPNSDTTLAESNADERVEPASLTKIMTAYVVFRELASGHLSLKDDVLISEKAWRTGGSKMFVEVGTRVSVEDLIKGMIIQSGNDAAVALAEKVAGSTDTFAELMNANAKRLGMTNSHFVNPDGLPDPNHYTTARDIAKVTAATIREFPQYYAWYAEKEFEFNHIKQPNRNLLLWRDKAVDGVKTGHTKEAGYCLVASAKQDGMRLISVVLGATGIEARAKDSLALLSYGFRFFESHKLYAAGQELQKLRVWTGNITELPVGPAQDVYVTIPRRRYDKLSAHIQKQAEIRAPLAKGTAVGTVVIELSGKEVRRVPLVALQKVVKGGLWARARDSVLQWF